jgi:hypothetical protein
MFDQSSQRTYAFEFRDNDDTEVIDVEEPPQLSRPRTATEDLTVHVYIQNDGKRKAGWHRLSANTMHTSCSTEEDPIPVSLRTDSPKNRRDIKHPLAPCECWTTAERREADRLYLEDFGRPYKP